MMRLVNWQEALSCDAWDDVSHKQYNLDEADGINHETDSKDYVMEIKSVELWIVTKMTVCELEGLNVTLIT